MIETRMSDRKAARVWRASACVALAFMLSFLGFPSAAFAYTDDSRQEFVDVDLSTGLLQEGGLNQENPSSNEDALTTMSASSSIDVEGFESALRVAIEGWEGESSKVVNVSSLNIPLDQIGTLYSSFLNRNGQYFYVKGNTTYSYTTSSKVVVSLVVNFDTGYRPSDITIFNAAVDAVLSGVNLRWSDEQIALYLHDYLVTHCEYDMTYSKYSAYNALIDGTAVCQGYTLAYGYLLSRVGVESDMITSDHLKHAWNLVTVDGSKYYVDCTFDDPANDWFEAYCIHNNFLCDRDSFETIGHASTDWLDSSGNNVYSQTGLADSTKYKSAYWRNVTTAIPHVGNLWAYVDSMQEGETVDVMAHDYATGANRVLATGLPGRWYTWDDSSKYWSSHYTSLVSNGEAFLASSPTSLYSISVDGASDVVYTLSDEEKSLGYIYGLRSSDSPGNFIYDLYTVALGTKKAGYGTFDFQASHTDDPQQDVTIASISYEPKAPCELGYAISHEGHDVYPLSFLIGDILALHYSDGMISHYRFDQVTNEGLTQGAFVNVRDAADVISRADVVLSSNQSVDAPWTLGMHEAVVTYKGKETTFPVKVTSNPVASISFVPASEREYVEGSGGHMETDGSGHRWFKYDMRFEEGNELRVLGTNGVEAVYVYEPSADESFGKFVNSKDADDVIGELYSYYEVEFSDDQSFASQWGVGSHSFTIGYMGKTCELQAHVVSSGDDNGDEPKTSLSGAQVTARNQVYTGSPLQPQPTVRLGGKTLEAETDYTVEYSDNVDAGTALITITGAGDYEGTASGTFVIGKADALLSFESARVSKSIGAAPFENKLAKTTDGTVSFTSSNESVATVDTTTGIVSVHGAGAAVITAQASEGKNYKSAEARYNLVVSGTGARDISTLDIEVDSAIYTGEEQTPAVTVQDGASTLRLGLDYEVSYSENVNAGTAWATITGKGSYTGSIQQDFTIAPAQITAMKLGADSAVFDGRFHIPLVESVDAGSLDVPLDGYTSSYSRDGLETVDFRSVGTITVLVTGRGNFTGSVSALFEIKGASDSGSSVDTGSTGSTSNSYAPIPLYSNDGGQSSGARQTSSGNSESVSNNNSGSGDSTTILSSPIAKRANTLEVEALGKTFKASKLKKKARSAMLVFVEDAQGSVSYENTSATKKLKKIKVNAKTGKITVPKGTKKGTYKVKVTVKAAGDAIYEAASMTVTCKIKVK